MQTLFSSIFLANGETSRGALWYWEQCDGAAKIVIAIIVVLSVWSVTAIVNKLLDLKKFRNGNARFEARLNAGKARLTQLRLERHPGASPYEMLTIEACLAYTRNGKHIRSEGDVDICMRHIENAVQRGMSRIMSNYEKSLVLLSSFAAGGPFLGLLGPVWGIIVTFGELSEKATISDLAPGVSGALVATLSGLLLAIPAVFFYNIILTRTKQLTMELEAFASMLLDKMELELYENLRSSEAGTPVPEAPAAQTAPAARVAKPPAQDGLINPYSNAE